MKNRRAVIGFLLLAGAGFLLLLNHGPAKVVPRQVKLTITGAEGQHFTGKYVSDGVTNSLSAVVPATVRLRAREVRYEFLPGDDRTEFRVALDVEDLNRTSFVSHQGKSVRGGWRYWNDGESAW